MKDSWKPLAKLLVDLGQLKTLPDVEAYSDSPDGFILSLELKGYLKEKAALLALASKLNLELYDLSDPLIRASLMKNEFINKAGPKLCWKYMAIPIAKKADAVEVAVSNPLDIDAQRAFEFALSQKVVLALAEEGAIKCLIRESFPDSTQEGEIPTPQTGRKVLGIGAKDYNVQGKGAAAAPVAMLIDKILSASVASNASDIHFEPMQYSMDVRFRIDGKMQLHTELPQALQSYVSSRLKILAGMDISERRKSQDGRFRIEVSGEKVDVRASLVPTAFGEKVVLRLLRMVADELTFADLGFSKELQKLLTKALELQGRMLLVTGPTGSGKTTTLYTALRQLKDGTSNIVTVEDPIEYRIHGINQIQINEAKNVTFPTSLRSILRQDPDVIMIGEIRDTETALIGVQAAQTGHKVLSTLHTNDAPSAITRLINLGISPYLLSTSLIGILAQRLVRKICSNCCKAVAPESIDAEEKEELESFGINLTLLKHGEGCEKCSQSGFQGRIGIYSYIDVNDTVADLISRGASNNKITEEAQKHGYLSLAMAALQRVNDGITTYEEALPYLREESKLGKDTTVLISESEIRELSNIVEKGEPSPAVSKKQPSSESELDKDGKIRKQRVLLVEDDKHLALIWSTVLKRAMYDLQHAVNGRDALDKVFDFAPEIIVCDLQMPVMGGREFVLNLRNNKRTKDIPVIILTSSDTADNEVDMLGLGVVDFISKDSAAEVVVARVRRVLNG